MELSEKNLSTIANMMGLTRELTTEEKIKVSKILENESKKTIIKFSDITKIWEKLQSQVKTGTLTFKEFGNAFHKIVCIEVDIDVYQAFMHDEFKAKIEDRREKNEII